MSVIITVDADALLDVQRRLKDIPKKAPNAISKSLNRAMTNAAVTLSQEIRKDYNIKAGEIKGSIKKTRANPGTLSAEVKSKGSVIPLDKFKTSRLMTTSNKGDVKSVSLNKKVVKAAVKKGAMKPVLGAFVVSLHGAKIFKRETKKRLPINRLFGPSVPQMGSNEKIAEAVNDKAEGMYSRTLDHEITRLLERLGG